MKRAFNCSSSAPVWSARIAAALAFARCQGDGHVAVGLARRRGDDQVGRAKLPAVKRHDVLQHKLRGIALLAIDVTLDVETDHVEAFGQEAIGPAAQTAEQINR